MTLKHLRIFAEVCRMESITEAAKNLNMAQPAVSNAIRELEAFYQVKLFERMNRRLYITNAGEYLRGYADSILTQFEESRDILQDIAASTRIRIGSNVSLPIICRRLFPISSRSTRRSSFYHDTEFKSY